MRHEEQLKDVLDRKRRALSKLSTKAGSDRLTLEQKRARLHATRTRRLIDAYREGGVDAVRDIVIDEQAATEQQVIKALDCIANELETQSRAVSFDEVHRLRSARTNFEAAKRGIALGAPHAAKMASLILEVGKADAERSNPQEYQMATAIPSHVSNGLKLAEILHELDEFKEWLAGYNLGLDGRPLPPEPAKKPARSKKA
jgi:hypothetical protein